MRVGFKGEEKWVWVKDIGEEKGGNQGGWGGEEIEGEVGKGEGKG